MAQPKTLTELPEEIIDMILRDVSKITSIYSMMWLRQVCRDFKNHLNRIIHNSAGFENLGGLMYQFWASDIPGKRWLKFPYDIRLQYMKRLRDTEPILGAQPRCYFYLWLSEMQQLTS